MPRVNIKEAREYGKQYYEKNRENKLVYAKAYSKKYYEENKERLKKKAKKRYKISTASHQACMKAKRKHNLELLDAIKLHYGCKNPNCQWVGEFVPCELDFHHLGIKSNSISKMVQSSLLKIAMEINKCTVLCSNCHRRLHNGNWSLIVNDYILCNVLVKGKLLIVEDYGKGI